MLLLLLLILLPACGPDGCARSARAVATWPELLSTIRLMDTASSLPGDSLLCTGCSRQIDAVTLVYDTLSAGGLAAVT